MLCEMREPVCQTGRGWPHGAGSPGRKPMSPRGLLLLAAWGAAMIAGPGPAKAEERHWTESTRLQVGVETRLRLLAEVPSHPERAARPHLVAIVWRYGEEGGERLLPSALEALQLLDRKSTRLNSSHVRISYAVICLKKKKKKKKEKKKKKKKTKKNENKKKKKKHNTPNKMSIEHVIT